MIKNNTIFLNINSFEGDAFGYGRDSFWDENCDIVENTTISSKAIKTLPSDELDLWDYYESNVSKINSIIELNAEYNE